MVKRMTAKDARNNFSQLLGMVHFGKDTVIVEKQGKPVVAVVDMEVYEKWIADREARFAVVNEIRARSRDKSQADVERDVAEALAAVRAVNRPRRRKRAQGRR